MLIRNLIYIDLRPETVYPNGRREEIREIVLYIVKIIKTKETN